LAWAGAARAAPVRLLVFGDSLAAGYGLPREQGFEAQLAAALKASGRDVVILDGGVSGDTTAGGRARIDWALSDAPDAALVELGGNDALRALDPAQMKANLGAVLDVLAAHRVKVLLEGMEAPRNLGPAYAASFHAVFAGLGARPGILYEPFFLEGVATSPELNQPDGIHPNAEGVRRVVAHVLPKVEALVDAAKK
jgi:acyl-CoA thioesterase-1